MAPYMVGVNSVFGPKNAVYGAVYGDSVYGAIYGVLLQLNLALPTIMIIIQLAVKQNVVIIVTKVIELIYQIKEKSSE